MSFSAIRTSLRAAWVALAFCGLLSGCDTPRDTVRPAGSAPRVEPPYTPKAFGKTNAPHIATRAIDADVVQGERMLERNPKLPSSYSRLLVALLRRSSRFGRIGDLDRVIELGDAAVVAMPTRAEAYELRARAHSAVHRFEDALTDLDRAAKLRKAGPGPIPLLRATALQGLGRYDEALALVDAHLAKLPKDAGSLSQRAMLLGHQNHFAKADAAFDAVAENYRGVSAPFVSWVLFERAAMWERAERPDRARLFYEKAVARLPRHAHAVGHLAQMVEPAEGTKLLRGTVASSEDPEYLGLLAHVLTRHGGERNPGEAASLLGKARDGYGKLIAKHPYAFADHAGWFYLVVDKNPAEAVAMARLNLKARQPPAGHELLVTALLASGDAKAACAAADAGLRHPYPTRAQRRVSARAYDACGRPNDAAAQRDALKR